MGILHGPVLNLLGGTFFGEVVTAMSVSSGLQDGHDSTDPPCSSGALVSSLSRSLAIIVASQMMEDY
jgi:hypothetical protein